MSDPKSNPPIGRARGSKGVLGATRVVPEAEQAAAAPRKAETGAGFGKIFASLTVLSLLVGTYFATSRGEAPAPEAATQTAQAQVESSTTTPEQTAVAAGTAADPVAPVLAGCEGAIVSDLATLEQATADGATWATHQSSVTQLVQSVINCEGTSFNVVGSLDLLDDNGADLMIRWLGSDKRLVLETVGVGTAPPVPAAEGDAAFVLR